MKVFNVIMVLVVLGCASPQQMMMDMNQRMRGRIDTKDVTDWQQFEADCQFCSQMAVEWQTKARNEMVGRAIGGMIIGAGVGLLVGEVFDVSRVGETAVVGAVGGGAGGVASVENHADEVFRNCMQNRGYKVYW